MTTSTRRGVDNTSHRLARTAASRDQSPQPEQAQRKIVGPWIMMCICVLTINQKKQALDPLSAGWGETILIDF